MLRQVKHWILPFSFLLLGGCVSSSVNLETSANVPTPLINPYPFNAAIFYPEETRQHAYKEESRDGKSWSVTTGNSQTQLFNKILGAMFTSTNNVEALRDVADKYDVVLIPKIKDMQFAVPRETKLDYYEVWIEYELTVMQPEGEEIAVIPFRGYGKSPRDFFTKDDKGLFEAANMAFRDLGAKFIVSFIQNPDIQKWRFSNTSATSGK